MCCLFSCLYKLIRCDDLCHKVYQIHGKESTHIKHHSKRKKWCLKFFLQIILTFLLTQLINFALDEYLLVGISSLFTNQIDQATEATTLGFTNNFVPHIPIVDKYKDYLKYFQRLKVSFVPMLSGI